MAGYLIAVSYDVAGVRKQITYGIEDGMCVDEASAISYAIDEVTNYRSRKGELLTNVTAIVSEVR